MQADVALSEELERSVPQTPPAERIDRPTIPALGAPELRYSFGILPVRQQLVVRLLRRGRADKIHAIKACWRGDHMLATGIIFLRIAYAINGVCALPNIW